MQTLVSLSCDYIDHASKAPLVFDIERTLPNLDPIHFCKIHMKGSRIHVIGARAVDSLAVDENIQVFAREASEHDIIGDSALRSLKTPGSSSMASPTSRAELSRFSAPSMLSFGAKPTTVTTIRTVAI